MNYGYAKNQSWFIKDELDKIQSEITTFETLTLGVGTWNLSGLKSHEQIDLKPWLNEFTDLIVLGF